MGLFIFILTFKCHQYTQFNKVFSLSNYELRRSINRVFLLELFRSLLEIALFIQSPWQEQLNNKLIIDNLTVGKTFVVIYILFIWT